MTPLLAPDMKARWLARLPLGWWGGKRARLPTTAAHRQLQDILNAGTPSTRKAQQALRMARSGNLKLDRLDVWQVMPSRAGREGKEEIITLSIAYHWLDYEGLTADGIDALYHHATQYTPILYLARRSKGGVKFRRGVEVLEKILRHPHTGPETFEEIVRGAGNQGLMQDDPPERVLAALYQRIRESPELKHHKRIRGILYEIGQTGALKLLEDLAADQQPDQQQCLTQLGLTEPESLEKWLQKYPNRWNEELLKPVLFTMLEANDHRARRWAFRYTRRWTR